MGMPWDKFNFGGIGGVGQILMGDNHDNKRQQQQAAGHYAGGGGGGGRGGYDYGPPAYSPQKPSAWWCDSYDGHPPPRAVDWHGGAQEKPPTQQRPPDEVNKMPEECKPPAEQEPLNAKKEPENSPSLPKASPTKHEGGYYGGGGRYPPAQRWGYPPSRPILPPPYQGGGQWDGYVAYAGAYMGWPKPAPPAGDYATYGAYHKHHGGYGGGRYGGGTGYGYGNGKYTMGHRGKFEQYAHHQGKY